MPLRALVVSHKFHCSSGDRIFEAEECDLSLQKRVPRSFTLTAHELVSYGLCAGWVGVE